jgi:hypothetical protein
MNVDLRVMRQGIDPTAESSLHALRDIMALPVLAVEHGERLHFELQDEQELRTLRDALAAAACQAGRYVNLNRDVLLWEEAESTQTPPREGCHVDVWVVQKDDHDARALQWFRQHTGLPLLRVQRGRWYRIHVATADPDEARRLVEDMAVSRTRRRGLLANPHAESMQILRVASNVSGGIHHAV